MAVADVLVGAISMPLNIALDVLVLERFLSRGVFCRIGLVNELVMLIGSCSSVYHLALIAWERYVAIRNWTESLSPKAV